MSKAEELDLIYQELRTAAPNLPLATNADDIVPGEGSPDAKILFIGEAPGYNESVEHRPFVGRSGQLFRQTLRETGLTEAEVYISNIVKARPPENRDPLPEEIEAYKPYLNREIETIKPLLIATLGRFSMGKFLPDAKVSQVHGRLHRIKWQERTLYIMPLYHPAAALRGTQIKTAFVTDIQKLPKVITWIHETAGEVELKQQIVEALF